MLSSVGLDCSWKTYCNEKWGELDANTKNCPLKCVIFQTNEENFTFVTFKTVVSIKWKLTHSRVSF